MVNKINLLHKPLLRYQYFNDSIKNKKWHFFDFEITTCKTTKKRQKEGQFTTPVPVEPKLSQKIKAIFENAERGKGKLIIPVMVLAEIGYLSEKERIETNLNEVKDYSLKYESIEIEPITEEIIFKTFEINDIPELHLIIRLKKWVKV